jgi:transitional endoplasmic reticulum ATPase
MRNELSGLTALSIPGVIVAGGLLVGSGLAPEKLQTVFSGVVPFIGSIVILGVSAGIVSFAAHVGWAISAKIGEPKIRNVVSSELLALGSITGIVIMTGLIVVQTPVLPNQLLQDTSTTSTLLVGVPMLLQSFRVYLPDMSLLERVEKESGSEYDVEYIKDQTSQLGEQTTNKFNDVNNPTNTESDSTVTPSDEELAEREPPQSKETTTTPTSTDLSSMQYPWRRETEVSFDDIGGMDSLKDELERDVIKPLTTHKEKAESLGVSAPNIVFHGPPGTGKTYMAKALATELQLPFVKLSGADIQSKWINESAGKVKELFNEAEEVAHNSGGAIVFLDELDSVLRNRSSGGGGHEEDNKVVNEFLNHLEDTTENDVVFIGATNRLESLDDAGIRAGRIDKKVHIGKPDFKARKKILQKQIENRPHDLTASDIDAVTEKTKGCVAADLELITKSAAKHVLGRDGEKIQRKDVEEAVAEAM